MGFFLSKKQKAEMRARRKKKRMANSDKDSSVQGNPSIEKKEGLRASIDNDSNENSQNAPFDEPNNRKRQRPDGEEEGDDSEIVGDTADGATQHAKNSPSSPLARKRPALDLQTKSIDGKLHVMLPYSVKDAKKFRKDARRQLRSIGNDDCEIVFIPEEELPSSFFRKKRKQVFPSIKELLENKQKLQKALKEEEKLKEKIQKIPQNVKDQYVALDCEMVGIGSDGKKSALARVSIVDWDLNTVLDSFVKVPVRVTDFRTHVSGVEAKHIKDKSAMDVGACRELVAEILKNKILVGHALTNDFKALMLNHPKAKIRDTAKYRPFQRYANGKWRPRKLRDLVKENVKGKESFQEAEHDSVQDARATMELFQLVRAQWEKEFDGKP